MALTRVDVVIDARLLAYRRGGIPRYIGELCHWLPEVETDLSVSCFSNRRTSSEASAPMRVFTPPHFRFERLTLGIEIMARRPHLIHSPDFIAPALTGSRRVITVHDLSFMRNPEHLSASSLRYYRQIHRSLACADAVIAVSRYTAEQLLQSTRVEKEKVFTVLNGVDGCRTIPQTDEARQRIRSALPAAAAAAVFSQRPIILSVGTIEPRKQQTLLLDSVRRLAENAPESSPLLLLVGQKGWSCAEIVSEIEKGVDEGHTVWLQSVDDETLFSLYRVADVLAMPSVDEGFGLPMLEAMQCGLPVVIANNGALPEVAGDAAEIVLSDDSETWSIELAALLQNRNKQEALRERGRIRAETLTWKRTAQQTAEVYRKVLKR